MEKPSLQQEMELELAKSFTTSKVGSTSINVCTKSASLLLIEAAQPRLIVETKEQKSKEAPDFSVGKQKFKSDLIPAALNLTGSFSSCISAATSSTASCR